MSASTTAGRREEPFRHASWGAMLDAARLLLLTGEIVPSEETQAKAREDARKAA
jgi:hypothetical protein